MNKKPKKPKANQGITQAEVRKKLNEALERRGEHKWLNGRLQTHGPAPKRQ